MFTHRRGLSSCRCLSRHSINPGQTASFLRGARSGIAVKGPEPHLYLSGSSGRHLAQAPGCEKGSRKKGSLLKRQNPQASVPVYREHARGGFAAKPLAKINRRTGYFKMASLNAFAARRRTTVLALILIASPVAGLRPMRALRCAFTARPMPGMTNLPAPLASFTASLNSSSKKDAACFFEIGFLGVLTLSAMWAIIFDLLNGVAIEFSFLLRCNCLSVPLPGCRGEL